MTQFTSSAKTLNYYVETKAITRLGEVFGNRLEKLTQEEKYQFCTAIALMLWGCCDSGPDEDDGLDFSDLVLEEDEADACRVVNDQLVPEVTGNVMTALVILQNEPPEILAQLLPAVAEYARDDDR